MKSWMSFTGQTGQHCKGERKMITDEIIEAIDTMQEMVKSERAKYYIGRVSDMLGDIDTDEWCAMSEEERQEWVKQYL